MGYGYGGKMIEHCNGVRLALQECGAPFLALWLASCGAGEEGATCGEGTIEQDGECVADPNAMPGAGGGEASGADDESGGGSSGMLGDDDPVSPYPECAYEGLKGATMALRTQ